MSFLDENGLAYFYSKLKEKFIRTVNGIGPSSTGNVTLAASNIGTSDNSNVQSKISTLETNVNSKAPTSHASSATTYGMGTTANYGHLKISDNYTSSAGAASAGVAASSKAVYDTYAKFANDILYFTGVTCTATTGNFVNYSNAAITANHILLDVSFAVPEYIGNSITWTTSSGNIKISGKCTTATTCYLILGKKQN